jgi:protein O-GlcNAc transferase
MFNWFKRSSRRNLSESATTPDIPTEMLQQRRANTISNTTETARLLVEHGMRYFQAGEYVKSGDTFRQALVFEPQNLTALYQSVSVYLALSDFAAARLACDHALTVLPDHAELMLLGALVSKRSGDHAQSLAELQRLQRQHPDFSELDMKIAETYATLGRGPEAIAAIDRAIVANPDELLRKSVRLFYLNFFGFMPRAQLFDEHRKWGTMIDEGFASLRKPLQPDTTMDRPLRVGLVSGDLRNHAVALFIEGYLREHDRNAFPIFCFDVSPHAEDVVTCKLRGMVEGWYRVAGLDDDALADEIRKQKIDLLVDLSGHTMFNRLLVFARRPAPVQVSWFGYMNTTGLTSIDYRLTDASVDPIGDSDEFYTEKLVRIPSLACFSPDSRSPAVAVSPFIEKKRVTFLSANQWTKVTDSVIALWAEVLCDESRPHLRICASGAGSATFRQSVVDQFVALGVQPEQIEFQPFLPLPEFLASFAEADVALDPFPYGGGTTTLHTVWMGVPIIALEGESELGRATPAMLRGFGLPDFIAQTHDEYRDKAINLARNPTGLIEIRANLRQRMAESAAVDAKSLARNVESAFRTMWHTYCATAQNTPHSR